MRTTLPNFTVAQGIEIQQRQLVGWSRILKPEVFIKLYAESTKDNHKAKDGNDIFRGCDIDNVVHNMVYDTEFDNPESSDTI